MKIVNKIILLKIIISFSSLVAIAASAETEIRCRQNHQLPIVTHWSNLTGEYFREPHWEEGAADQFFDVHPTPIRGEHKPGKCYYTYGRFLLPDFEKYLAESFSIKSISDRNAKKFAEDFCRDNQVPLRFFKPASVDSLKTVLKSNSGVVQVVSGMIVRNSLVTLILPPNWSKDAPAGTYPIVTSTLYDLNQYMFSEEGGKLMASLIAESAKSGRSGAIGVLWNGGAVAASRTVSPGARVQFNAIMKLIHSSFGGDHSRVLMYGASRGAMAALMMASNPDPHDYTIRYVHAVVPGVKLGALASVIGPTLPGLFLASDYTVGLSDAWRFDWKHPGCGRPGLKGLTGSQAHLKILTGVTDADLADQEYSPISDRFMRALKAAGTQIKLEFSSHDFIISYANEVEYLRKLEREGIPTEANIFLRSGHEPPLESSWFKKSLLPVLISYVDPQGPPLSAPRVNPGALDFYAMNRNTLSLEKLALPDGRFPFTLEVPRRIYRGMNAPLIAVGEPGTEFEIVLQRDGNPAVKSFSGVIQDSGSQMLWLGLGDPSTEGVWRYTSVRIKKIGTDWKALDTSETPTASRLSLYTEVLGEAPNINGQAMADLVGNPDPVRTAKSVNWGISEW